MFEQLASLLKKHSKGLELRSTTIGSKTTSKRSLHLYGKKPVVIMNRKPQQTYVSGIIQQKGYVGFYSMPVYSHPKEISLSPELKRMLKGKSCIHIKELDKKTLAELDRILKKGILLYKKEGWI